MGYKQKLKKKSSNKQQEPQTYTPVPVIAIKTAKEPGAKGQAGGMPKSRPQKSSVTLRPYGGTSFEEFSVDLTTILGLDRKVVLITTKEYLQEMLIVYLCKLAEKGEDSILLEADRTCNTVKKLFSNPQPSDEDWNKLAYIACSIVATVMKLMYGQTTYGMAQDGKTLVDLYSNSSSDAVPNTGSPAAVAVTNTQVSNGAVAPTTNPSPNTPDTALVTTAKPSRPAVPTHPDAQLNNITVLPDFIIPNSSPAAPDADSDCHSPAPSSAPSRMSSFMSATATATSWFKRVFTKTAQAVKKAAAVATVLLGSQNGREKYLTVILL